MGCHRRMLAFGIGGAMTVRLVTAFYPGPSKHSSTAYAIWASHLFTHCDDAITCFVPDADVARRVAHWAGHRASVRTRVVPAEELPALEYVHDWDAQTALDPERHLHRGSHVYKVWNSKPFLVQAVAEQSAASDLVFWIDIGYVRDARTGESLHRLRSDDLKAVLGNGRTHLLALRNFSRSERSGSAGITPDAFLRSTRLGGGMFGGTVESCGRWSASYGEALRCFSQRGCFVGKEQNVVAALALREPHRVHVWRAPRFGGDPWFSFPRAVGRTETRLR
jgi:hypothetical protein